jgi:hypothetical protein
MIRTVALSSFQFYLRLRQHAAGTFGKTVEVIAHDAFPSFSSLDTVSMMSSA